MIVEHIQAQRRLDSMFGWRNEISWDINDIKFDEMMCTVMTLEPAKVDVRFQLVEVHQVVHQKVQVVQVDQVDLELVELVELGA